MAEEYSGVDTMDFRRARSKSFMRQMWSLVSGQNADLMAWDVVRDSLKLRGFIRRGMQEVPVETVVSVGRFRDFDDAFLPTQDATIGRWRKINRAFYNDVSLPPVNLYKVGDVYFVLDGNHRVSVAKEHGVKFIDADVQEAVTAVPLTADDIDADALTLLGEYAEFLERTHLDKLRPTRTFASLLVVATHDCSNTSPCIATSWVWTCVATLARTMPSPTGTTRSTCPSSNRSERKRTRRLSGPHRGRLVFVDHRPQTLSERRIGSRDSPKKPRRIMPTGPATNPRSNGYARPSTVSSAHFRRAMAQALCPTKFVALPAPKSYVGSCGITHTTNGNGRSGCACAIARAPTWFC